MRPLLLWHVWGQCSGGETKRKRIRDNNERRDGLIRAACTLSSRIHETGRGSKPGAKAQRLTESLFQH